jgi:hypothetical protein
MHASNYKADVGPRVSSQTRRQMCILVYILIHLFASPEAYFFDRSTIELLYYIDTSR